MSRLLSRQTFVPGGYKFYIAPLKWQAPPNQSFDLVVRGAIAALQGNPPVAKALGWDLAYNAMADRVDAFNAHICEANGWDKYIQSQGGSVPKSKPLNQSDLLQKLRAAAVASRQLIAGAKTLIEFMASGQAPVSPELAEHRAIVCTQCPKNEKGGYEAWFTKPASELIRRQLTEAQQRKLTTPRDEQLNICTACLCPLRLKVWIPITWIVKNFNPQQMEALKQGRDCWILNERERL